jgi:hypothetical protein
VTNPNLVYVEFPGGNRAPGGYIVPAYLTGRTSGRQSQVVLTASTNGHRYAWPQWVRNGQILTDEEVSELGPD